MQLEDGLLHRRVSAGTGLDEKHMFFRGFTDPFPGEKRLYAGQDIDAGGQFAVEQRLRDVFRAVRIGTGVQYYAMVVAHGATNCSKVAGYCRIAHALSSPVRRVTFTK